MHRGQTYVREEIEAPAETIWQLIRDFADISAWTPSPVVRTEGTGIGMIRHIESRVEYVRERCEAHDDTMMTFTYRLLESPWPFENVVKVQLTASTADTTCVVKISERVSLPEVVPDMIRLNLAFHHAMAHTEIQVQMS